VNLINIVKKQFVILFLSGIFSVIIHPAMAVVASDTAQKVKPQTIGVAPAMMDIAPSGYKSVKDFGAKCDGVTDDAASFQKALNASKTVFIPRGTCIVNSTILLRAGSDLRGDGMGVSTVKKGGISAASMGAFYAYSASAGEMLDGIQISKMTLDGQSDVFGFSEFQHLISLNGVKNALVDNVEFRGFQGDGLFIGSGASGRDERHNENITVRNNVFDGVNYSNRNGISILDGNGILIEGNSFRNTSQNNMPGAIDIEPENSYHLVKHITIRNNDFANIGGNVAAIAFVLNQSISKASSGFRVIGNSILGANVGIVFLSRIRPNKDTIQHDFVVSNNIVTTSGRAFVLSGVKGFNVYANAFTGAGSPSLVGYLAETDKCMDGNIYDNVFWDKKHDGLVVFSAENVQIYSNRFVDTGRANIGSYRSDFNFSTSSFVRVWSDIVTATSGKTVYAVQSETLKALQPPSVSAKNNQFIGVSGTASQ